MGWKESHDSVKLGYLPIGGVVLRSWITFAITARYAS